MAAVVLMGRLVRKHAIALYFSFLIFELCLSFSRSDNRKRCLHFKYFSENVIFIMADITCVFKFSQFHDCRVCDVFVLHARRSRSLRVECIDGIRARACSADTRR